MEWFILTLVSAGLWGIKNIVDKIYLSKLRINPTSMAFVMFLFNCVFAGMLWFIFPIVTDIQLIFYGVLVGLPHVFSYIGYTHAIDKDEISRGFALIEISPIFAIILGAVFLAERLAVTDYVGIVVIVIGAIVLSIKSLKDLKISPSTKWAIFTAFMFAVYAIIIKFSSSMLDVWSIFFWSSMTSLVLISSILFKKSHRKEVKRFFSIKKRYLGTYFISTMFSVSARILFMMALAIGSASLVQGVSATQPLITLLFATLITLFFPKILKEDLAKKNFLSKLVGIILIIVGTVLII